MGFLLKIITPKGVYLSKEIDSLNIKLSTGYRTILKNHANLIGVLDYAPMHIVNGKEVDFYALHGGAINVKNGEVSLITNAIEHAKDIDVARAKAAKKRAQDRINAKDSNTDIKRAQLALARAVARLKVTNQN